MNYQKFVDAVYQSGWRPDLDAQHSEIKKLWEAMFPFAAELEEDIAERDARIRDLEAELKEVQSRLNASSREIDRLFDELEGYKESKLSRDGLIREIDKIITDGKPAKQASLCDLVLPIRKLKEERDTARREAAEAQASRIMAFREIETGEIRDTLYSHHDDHDYEEVWITPVISDCCFALQSAIEQTVALHRTELLDGLAKRIGEMREAAYTFGDLSKEAVRIVFDGVLDEIDAARKGGAE